MDLPLALLVLTTIALVTGGIVLWRREGRRKQAVLMFALAAVLAGNIAIWTTPTRQGTTLAGEAAKGP